MEILKRVGLKLARLILALEQAEVLLNSTQMVVAAKVRPPVVTALLVILMPMVIAVACLSKTTLLAVAAFPID